MQYAAVQVSGRRLKILCLDYRDARHPLGSTRKYVRFDCKSAIGEGLGERSLCPELGRLKTLNVLAYKSV